jgi:hypothetical protein
MTDSKAIERHVTKMAVLGGQFKLGDFYDYRNDSILSGTNNYYINTVYIIYVTGLCVLLFLKMVGSVGNRLLE